MQSIDSYNPNLGTAIGVSGPAGSGKTALLMSLFPGTYVIVMDQNFENGLEHLRSIGKSSNIVGFDNVYVDEAGVAVPPYKWNDRLYELLKAALKEPSIDAILVDGATQITECFIASPAISNAQRVADIQIKGEKESRQKWGSLAVAWRGLVTQLRQTGKKILLPIHETQDKSEVDNIWRNGLAIPGQTANSLSSMLSDVWRTYICNPTGKLGGEEYWVQTMPTEYKIEYIRKGRFKNLPSKLKQDDLVQKVQAQIQ